ncbi:MAG: radical SAM protein [Sphingomonadaceae bacterium]
MLLTDEADSRGRVTLMLHLTGRCNLRCRHCYMEGGPDRRDTLATGPVLEAIAAAPGLGVGALYLTGGEPTLHPDLEAVLDAAAALGRSVETTLCSNGTRLTPAFAEGLAQRRFRLNISLDGEAAFHDRFRRLKGSRDAAAGGAAMAIAAGVPLTLVMSVGRTNLGQVEPMIGEALAMGAAAFRAQPLLDLGRGQQLSGDQLAAAELDRLILTLNDWANRLSGSMAISLIGQSIRYLRAHPCAAYVCNGGGCHRRVEREVKKIVVRETGDILPEATNLSPAFAVGRLGEAPLRQLMLDWLEHDYPRFDDLCRRTYARHVPGWDKAVIPWDQLLAAASHEAGSVATPTLH